MSVVLLDVDGVAADFTGRYLEIARLVTSREFHREQVTQWSLEQSLDLNQVEATEVHNLITYGEVALVLDDLPGAKAAVQRLMERHDVVFVTAPYSRCRTWAADREAWLRRFVGDTDVKVIHTAHKQYVRGDIFVDDKPENVIEWARANPKRPAILWAQPSNQDHPKLPGNAERSSDWQLVELLADAYSF